MQIHSFRHFSASSSQDQRAMMESVVEGQDKVAEILSDREAELVEARKERDNREEALQKAAEEENKCQNTIADLKKEIG